MAVESCDNRLQEGPIHFRSKNTRVWLLQVKIIQEPLPALPTDTATLMRVAKWAILDNPGKRPSINEILSVL